MGMMKERWEEIKRLQPQLASANPETTNNKLAFVRN